MSKLWKPKNYTGRALQNQLLNCMISSHDLCCGCDKPVQHINKITSEALCRHFKDTGTTTNQDGDATAAEDFDLDAGDLERLFEIEKEDER